MKNFLGIILFLLYQNIGIGQSYINNGGFEEFYNCPSELSEFNALRWFNPAGNKASPDLYSSCASIKSRVNTGNSYVNIPAFEDSSYVGIIAYSKLFAYREYISTLLNKELKKGSSYQIELSICFPHFSKWTIEDIGLLFTYSKPKATNSRNMGIQPTIIISVDNPIIGKWMTLRYSFIATGKEKYLTIGNFNSNHNTAKKVIPNHKSFLKNFPFLNYGYCLIDNVSLIDSPLEKAKGSTPKIRQ